MVSVKMGKIEALQNNIEINFESINNNLTIQPMEAINNLILKTMCDISIEQFSNLTLDAILENVSSVTGIDIAVLKSDWQKREVVEARQAYFILSKQILGSSLKNIGKKVGNRNHATVIWGIKQAHIPEISRIVTNVKTMYYANV